MRFFINLALLLNDRQLDLVFQGAQFALVFAAGVLVGKLI